MIAYKTTEYINMFYYFQPNGTVYTFGRDVNILWRHGIRQLPPSMQNNNGRISIICWGWVETFDM